MIPTKMERRKKYVCNFFTLSRRELGFINDVKKLDVSKAL